MHSVRNKWTLIQIKRVLGSSPRAEGTKMWINSDSQVGSIGGGKLEYLATKKAREMILEDFEDFEMSFSLGPSLGQCCGGIVDLAFSRVMAPEPREFRGLPMVLYGCGHVGEEIKSLMLSVPFPLITFDDRENRAADYSELSVLMRKLPQKAYHLVMTYSHELDFEICRQLLAAKVKGTVALIGSKSKRASFGSRLRQLNLDPTRINCPIGVTGIRGKEPSVIAISAVAEFLLWQSSHDIISTRRGKSVSGATG